MKLSRLLITLLFLSLSKLTATDLYRDSFAQANKALIDLKNDITTLKAKKTKVQLKDIAQLEDKTAQIYKILQNAEESAINSAQKTAPLKLIKDRITPLEKEIDTFRNQL